MDGEIVPVTGCGPGSGTDCAKGRARAAGRIALTAWPGVQPGCAVLCHLGGERNPTRYG
jgi:hypothetical protein